MLGLKAVNAPDDRKCVCQGSPQSLSYDCRDWVGVCVFFGNRQPSFSEVSRNTEMLKLGGIIPSAQRSDTLE